MFSFIKFQFLDILDIVLVAILLYQLYKMIRGTVAINIFVGIFIVYLIWLIVRALNMELLSSILGQFIGVGVIALIIVFQQEIRRFLVVISTRYLSKDKFLLEKLFNTETSQITEQDINALCNSIEKMSKTNTGALIVLSNNTDLPTISQTGEVISAKINEHLIESIFFKNSPLHDGALIVVGNRIKAARCILPSTLRQDLPSHYGTRHRAAIGISEETNTLTIIVSEETGQISYAISGDIKSINDSVKLKKIITNQLR